MRHTIKIYYFPKALRYIAVVLLLGAGYLIYIDFKIWAIIDVFVSIFIMTARYVTIIDVTQKVFIDAFEFYGIDIVTERNRFTILNKIIVTKGSYSQNINTRSQSRRLDWTDYTGTLIYDGNGTLDLLTREDKKELVEALWIYADALGVTVEDHSSRSSSRS